MKSCQHAFPCVDDWPFSNNLLELRQAVVLDCPVQVVNVESGHLCQLLCPLDAAAARALSASAHSSCHGCVCCLSRPDAVLMM
jgi:hypothetical protein